MLRLRCHRLTAAFIVALSLLFSQLAVAAYVCPAQADVQTMAAMMKAGQPCDGMDPQQPALCHEHTAPLAKTFEAAKLPVLGPPLLVQVLELPFALLSREAQAVPSTASVSAQPPPDPVFLSTLRLRV
ncbi:MAG: hypothetical protein J0M20_06495 [Burkholderiales bacterium]|nr:hypothetical protein [Burkholderiales bacterium]